MYNNKMVVSIKSNGKVLREVKDTVYLPFGVEYSIYLKNLNTQRAKVYISIDGKDICSGAIVVNPGQSIDLERFVENNYTGNRLKFIARTKKIEDHRGIGAEDGIIRVEFAYEEKPVYTTRQPIYPMTYDIWQQPYHTPVCCDAVAQSYSCSTISSVTTNSVLRSMAVNDAGITVPGSISNQEFTTIQDFKTGESEVIVLKLLGEVGDQKVSYPITVKTKKECPTCGTINSFKSKFCFECGTSLV